MTLMNTGPEKPVERDTSPVLLLGGLLVALVIFLVVCGFLSQTGMGKLVEYQESEMRYGEAGTEVSDARARDEAKLTSYDETDKSRGLYQVPVAKAMEMLVDYKSLDLDHALER